MYYTLEEKNYVENVLQRKMTEYELFIFEIAYNMGMTHEAKITIKTIKDKLATD